MRTKKICNFGNCEVELSRQNETAHCVLHWRFREKRICEFTTCSNLITDSNKTGYCSDHYYHYWRTENPEISAERQAKSYKIRRSAMSSDDLMVARFSKHHITVEDFDNLVLYQNGLCPICKDWLPEIDLSDPTLIHIDHDKSCCPGVASCGKCVRGVLHRYCNIELGKLESFRLRDWSDYDAYLNAYLELGV